MLNVILAVLLHGSIIALSTTLSVSHGWLLCDDLLAAVFRAFGNATTLYASSEVSGQRRTASYHSAMQYQRVSTAGSAERVVESRLVPVLYPQTGI